MLKVSKVVLEHSDYEPVGDMGVTTTLRPIREVLLARRHSDSINSLANPQDNAFKVFGSGMHLIAQNAYEAENKRLGYERYATEQRLSATINGIEFGGTTDVVDKDELILADWKTTSIYKAQEASTNEDYIMQLNIYRYLYWLNYGVRIKRLVIIALAKDWTASGKHRDKDYPDSAHFEADLPILADEVVLKHIEDYIELYKANLEVADDKLPYCTKEQMWASGGNWALMAKGSKRATKLHSSLEEANKHLENIVKSTGKEYYLEERREKRMKCEAYCSSAPYCNQFKEWVNANQ